MTKDLIPFQTEVLAAYPCTSRNNRIYTKELLSNAGPAFVEKPFICDHDYEECEKVIGKWTGQYYGLGKLPDGTEKEGLWLKGIGLMPKNLFEKVCTDRKNGIGPLIRGISIGGDGEAELTQKGIELKDFTPAEASLTAFPGIPEAQIVSCTEIREHYLGDKNLSTETKTPVTETIIPEPIKEAKTEPVKIKEDDDANDAISAVGTAVSMCLECGEQLTDGKCTNKECKSKESAKPKITEKVNVKETTTTTDNGKFKETAKITPETPVTTAPTPKLVTTVGVGEGISVQDEAKTAAKIKDGKVYTASEMMIKNAEDMKALVAKHKGDTGAAFREWSKNRQ